MTLKRQAGFLCLFFAISPLMPGRGYAKEAETPEKKMELVDRIRLVLQYGHSVQVRDTLPKILKLSEEEQKSLIPDLKELIANDDPLVRIAMAELVSKLKWDDLDKEILIFLESDDYQVVINTLTAVRQKKMDAAKKPVTKAILEADFTEESKTLPEFLSIAALFHDSALADPLFEKLKEEETELTYQLLIVSFFSGYEDIDMAVLEYFNSIYTDEEVSMSLRRRAIYVLGKHDYQEAAKQMKEELDEISSWTDIDKKAKYSDYRNALMTALIMMGDSDVADLLLEMARDDNASVRYKAVEQFGDLGDPKYRELLEYKSRYDDNPKVQQAAKEALKKIDENPRKTKTSDRPAKTVKTSEPGAKEQMPADEQLESDDETSQRQNGAGEPPETKTGSDAPQAPHKTNEIKEGDTGKSNETGESQPKSDGLSEPDGLEDLGDDELLGG